MKRDNHYEAAFEAYLRRCGVAVVPVDEARRSYLDEEEVRSPDFILVGPEDARLVVDVKGRKFPGTSGGKVVRSWQNWVEADSVEGLSRWSGRLGDGFRGILAFVYQIDASVMLPPFTPDVFAYRDDVYLARGICVRDYREHMKPRSSRWGTVDLPAADFRRIVRPFSEFLKTGHSEGSENIRWPQKGAKKHKNEEQAPVATM
jgi:hypothetical protein